MGRERVWRGGEGSKRRSRIWDREEGGRWGRVEIGGRVRVWVWGEGDEVIVGLVGFLEG